MMTSTMPPISDTLTDAVLGVCWYRYHFNFGKQSTKCMLATKSSLLMRRRGAATVQRLIHLLFSFSSDRADAPPYKIDDLGRHPFHKLMPWSSSAVPSSGGPLIPLTLVDRDINPGDTLALSPFLLSRPLYPVPPCHRQKLTGAKTGCRISLRHPLCRRCRPSAHPGWLSLHCRHTIWLARYRM